MINLKSIKQENAKVSTKIRAEFLAKYITQKKYTQKELSVLVNHKFKAHTVAANNTLLVDCKNVLYYKSAQFDKIVIVDDNKVMKFANYSAKEVESMKVKAQKAKEVRKAESTKEAAKEATKK